MFTGGKERMEICKACPHLNSLRMCGKCGCFMPAKTKLAWASCPIGKWEAEGEEPEEIVMEENEDYIYKNEHGQCCSDQGVYLPDGTEKKITSCWECDDG